jgi:diguanylate cyclase (GGDEF)-like protein
MIADRRAKSRGLARWVALFLALFVLVAIAHPLAASRPALILSTRVISVVLAPIALLLWLRRPPRAAFVLGPTLLAILETVIAATGGHARSPVQPLIYVLLAMVAGLGAPLAAIVTAVLAALMEIALATLGSPPSLSLQLALAHVGFMALFASLFQFLLIAETRLQKKTADDAVRDALERVEQDARDFRLIGSSLGPESRTERDPDEAMRKRQVGSVRAIRESLLDVLEVARLSVHADAAMLFVLNEDGSRLKLKECVATGSERSIIERPISASEGALGAVVKTGRSVNLIPREGGRHLGYTTRDEIGSFLGVPVRDGKHLSGVLAVDRKDSGPFSDHDEELLDAVSREAQRAMESERIFVSMDRVKYEQERLYDAFALLNEALTVDAFAERLLDAVIRIKPLDFMCVTLFDEEKREHQIVALRSEDESDRRLMGATYPHKHGGLVAMSVKNGHPLPYVPLSEQPDKDKLQLFGDHETPSLESVKVFPLVERGRPRGTLVLGSRNAGGDLSREDERMIDVITAHAAITLANAEMYKKMEMMATTDGLTGLVNHRRFKELLEEALARATRFSRKVSVLMVDADHFKTVNDTYGHPVGDVVLKRIAHLLQAEARRTDVVARYGGEEFVVILDETDSEGAVMVAERIRERIEADVIQGDFGRVKVTASLGLATWPDATDAKSSRQAAEVGARDPRDAETMGELLERADQALYEAKRKGRNRVVRWKTSPRSERHPGHATSERPSQRPA